MTSTQSISPGPDGRELAEALIKSSRESIAALREQADLLSGMALLDLIRQDIQQLRQRMTDPRTMAALMPGIQAATWINKQMEAWLGERQAADTLSQSVPNNVTSEMGLALLDVADAIRPYPEAVAALRDAAPGSYPEIFEGLRGGTEAIRAIHAYLDAYGMRCAGEIDITQTRWSEDPTVIFPAILSSIRNASPGAGPLKFRQGLEEAAKKEQELLARLEALPDGRQKAAETKEKIDTLRNLIGYREYPKYDIVSRLAIYREGLLKEADQLLREGTIDHREDIYYLTFDELCEVVRTRKLSRDLISERKALHARHEELTPPRVMTSEGEIVTGTYSHAALPEGAFAGLPVSSGIVEGRARIILDLKDADLEADDILVTVFTDPSWTPLFISVKGLVTEVGGLMTHGAVIAREYGLPAVVGVENATSLIRDGQRIRVNGVEGYVEVLDEE